MVVDVLAGAPDFIALKAGFQRTDVGGVGAQFAGEDLEETHHVLNMAAGKMDRLPVGGVELGGGDIEPRQGGARTALSGSRQPVTGVPAANGVPR